MQKLRSRSGYRMPTQKKIKSALRSRSKTFLIKLIMSMFSALPKASKIRFLIKIDRKAVGRRIRRATKRRSSKRRVRRSKSKKRRSAKQRANDKRLGRMAKSKRR